MGVKVHKQPVSFLRTDLLKTDGHADEAVLVLAPPDVLEVADVLASLQWHGCQEVQPPQLSSLSKETEGQSRAGLDDPCSSTLTVLRRSLLLPQSWHETFSKRDIYLCK